MFALCYQKLKKIETVVEKSVHYMCGALILLLNLEQNTANLSKILSKIGRNKKNS